MATKTINRKGPQAQQDSSRRVRAARKVKRFDFAVQFVWVEKPISTRPPPKAEEPVPQPAEQPVAEQPGAGRPHPKKLTRTTGCRRQL